MTTADHYGGAMTWGIIVVLGLGTFLLRYSFLGLIGSRPLPAWALRYLRYTAVAVLPGLVAPLVLWPEAAAGSGADPVRLLAAAVTVAAGIATRNTLAAIVGGFAALYLGLWLAG